MCEDSGGSPDRRPGPVNEAREAAPPAVSVRDLHLEARGRTLIAGGAFEVRSGELCLLVGASGTGKSLTLQLLSGLLRPTGPVRASGRVEVLGRDAMEAARKGRPVPDTGVLFQELALFDDLDARANVLFGIDHRQSPPEDRREEARALLEEMRLPPDATPAQLSGGMRQRLALARVLAYRPRVVFYDEPTSGLDPALSRQVAERIRAVHEHHGMTSLVVTHDLASVLPVADRVVFLDPRRRCFQEIGPGQADATLAALASWRPEETPSPRVRRGLGARLQAFLEGWGGFVQAAGATTAALVPRFPRARWGLHMLWHHLKLTALGSALPFHALAGLIAGFITTFFMFALLPLRGYTEPVLPEEFVGSLGFTLYRVVVPGITALLFASRSGAAAAADVGTRALSRQTDALRVHGVPPQRYLLTGLALSAVLGIPVLFLISFLVTRVTALAVYLAHHPEHGPFAFDARFFHLVGMEGLLPGGTHWILGKLVLSALGTAGIAYHLAMRPHRSGSEVARSVTDTIIRATVFTLVVHLLFALFEY